MKKLLLAALAAALWCVPSFGQGQNSSLSNPVGGAISVSGANCAVANVCVWQKLPSTATTTTVTITGTFSATLIVESSGDGGTTWTQQSSQTAATVVTFTTTSLTDVRVRCSAFVSGTASVNIQTAGNQINVTTGGGAGIAGTFLIGNLPCTGLSNCLQWVDDDVTDNCGAALTAFMASVNAYSGNGIPQLFITGQGIGKAYKLATTNCKLAFLIPTTLHLWANLDCAQTGTNCIQAGPTGLSGLTAAQSMKYQIDGSGTLLGGANLTVAGIEAEPFISNLVVKDINFQNFGATNATIGLCTNYAIQFDSHVAEGLVSGTEWLASDATVNRCGYNDAGFQGSNTILFYDNVMGGAGATGLTCSSVAIYDAGSYGEIRGNNIYGFGISSRLAGVGHRINSNQYDAAGCAVGGINAAVQFGATGSAVAVGPIVLTNNVAQYGGGHTTNLMAKAADSTATIFSVSFTGNQSIIGGAPTQAGQLLPANTNCSPNINSGTACYEYGNPAMTALVTCGTANIGWYYGDLAASCVNSAQVANLGSTTLFTPTSTQGITVSAQVILTTAATTSSTLPTVSVTYTDVFTNAVLTVPLTPTWATSTVNCGGSATNTIGNSCQGTSGVIAPKPATAVTYTTANYASVGGTPMQYQILVRANLQ